MQKGGPSLTGQPPAFGAFVVDKPPGLTSHDVVDRVRKIVGVRRVGHGGTLDPMATGVLVVAVGPATRLLSFVAGSQKAYRGSIRLGWSTTTDDKEGEPLVDEPGPPIHTVSGEDIDMAVAKFVGSVSQRPSSVSAVKIGGRAAHRRVRDGEHVEIAPREVTIDSFDVLSVEHHDAWIDLDVDVVCSSGTYVRALARDLGAALGIGGHLTALRRTRVGSFHIDEAAELEDIRAEMLISPTVLAKRIMPVLDVDEETGALARHGTRVALPLASKAETALIGPDGDLIAVVRPGQGTLEYVAVFP